MEVELKLLIEAADVPALKRHPLVEAHAQDAAVRRQMTSLYFDTPELHLRKHGLGLRVRRSGGRWTQTLKSEGRVAGGLHEREEWESPVLEPRPDLDALRTLVPQGSAWDVALTAKNLAERLVPIFGVRYRRTLWRLSFTQGEDVELALDEGELQCGTTVEPVREVELELVSGHAATLFDFALHLQHTVPLRPTNTSKAERGYALLAQKPLAAVKATPLALDPHMTVEQALQAIVANALGQVQDNEAGVMRGTDPECVHQMRVGIRRLRSALRLFARVAPLPQALQADLQWLGGELGGARDWEVLAGSTLAAVAVACPGETGLVDLRQAALARAAQKRQAAAAAVGSARYARLLLGLAGWAQATRWRDAIDAPLLEALDAPLGAFAAKVLRKRHARLTQRGARLPHATPEERHLARISAKQLRYASEFFQALYPARRVKRMVGRLAALQDALGWLNDAAVADKLLQELAHEQPALEHSAGFARGGLAGRSEAAVRSVNKRWKRFAAAEPPWTH